MAALALVSRNSSLADRVAEVELIASTLEAIDEAEAAGADPLAPELLESLQAELCRAIAGTREKIDRTAAVLAHYEAAAESAKREAKRLALRAQHAERQRERLESYVMAVLKASNIKKLDGNTVTLTARLNPAAVVIDDNDLLPDSYKRVPPPPAAVPDKTAIKAAIAAGVDVPGARLQRGERLEVR